MKTKLKSCKSLENIMAKFSISVFITSIKMTKNMNSSVEKRDKNVGRPYIVKINDHIKMFQMYVVQNIAFHVYKDFGE